MSCRSPPVYSIESAGSALIGATLPSIGRCRGCESWRTGGVDTARFRTVSP